LGVENNQGIDHRIEDGLGVFPFVDRLVDTCTKRRDVGESEYRAKNLAIASGVWGYAKKKKPIALADFAPAWRSVNNHLRAQRIEIPEAAGKNTGERPANIRNHQTQHRRGGAVKAGNPAIAINDNYREIDRVKDADNAGGDTVEARSFAWHSTDSQQFVLVGHEVRLSGPFNQGRFDPGQSASTDR
jgi:hypothetical protein